MSRQSNGGLFAPTFNTTAQQRVDDGARNDMITGYLPAILCGPIEITAPAAFWLGVANQNRGPARTYLHASSLVVDLTRGSDQPAEEGKLEGPEPPTFK